jgi:glyoxylase-like metal-dependent hydrolase (beta-lactamase superfamily II)
MKRFLSVAVLAVALAGCQAFERTAINGSIRSAFLEINTPGTGVTKLADNLYSMKWYGYRTAFVTTPDGVIVFDPLNVDAAKKLQAEIVKVAPNPAIRYVIYSHSHADHTAGARALGGNPVILAHAACAKTIAERPDPDVVPPTETFDGESKELTLGGTTLQLIHVPGAHTEGLIAVHLPKQRALYLVDIVAVKMLPPFGSPDNSYHGVLQALRKLEGLDYDTLIPGHGEVGTKADVTAFASLLTDMEQAIRTAAQTEGMSPMRGNPEAIANPKVGEVLFAATDALEPKYGAWQGWAHNSLQALQWVFLYGVYMNE